MTSITLVLGPWASEGVQLIAPVPGTIVMPLGCAPRLKASVLAGRSGSVALADTFSAVNSSIVWSAGTKTDGALFTSLTVTVNVLVTLSDGLPLSVTATA